MTALNFPASPAVNDTYEVNGITYVWTGGFWDSVGAETPVFVKIPGDTMTGNLTVPSLNNGQLAGFRNKIINGGFQVDQRGGPHNSTGGDYGVDRWKSTVHGSSNTRQERKQDSTLEFYLEVIQDAVSTDTIGITQIIEDGAIGNAGRTMTLSFEVMGKGQSNFNMGASILINGSKISDVSTTVASDSSYQTYTHTFTVPAAPASNNMEVDIATSTTGQYKGINIKNIQLESGPVATSFEQRPIGIEYQLCLRYYWYLRQNVYLNPDSINGGALIFRTELYFPSWMRTAPTLSTIPPGATTPANPSVNFHAISNSCGRMETQADSSTQQFISLLVADAEL